MQLQNFYAQDVNGNIVPGASCTLFIAGTTTLATGLKDAAGNPLSNPFFADSNGLASVSAAQGLYDLQMISGLLTSKIQIQFIDAVQVAADAASASASASSAATSATNTQTLYNSLTSTSGATLIKTSDGASVQVKLDSKASKGSQGRTDLGLDLATGTGAAAYIGYRGRTVGARLDDIFNVKDYGAVGDGSTNDSPAFQAAFDAAKARGRGLIYAPSAQYLLNSLVTAQDFHWAFFGDGQEQTVLLVNNTTGGISFTSTGRTGTEWMSITGGYTMVSYAPSAGAVSRGKGLSIVYPTSSFAPATPNCIVDDIHCRGMGYSINTATDPYFTDGIYVRNASNSRISRFNSDQNANKLYTGINLDYPTTVGKFRISIDSFSLQGGLYGIRAVGAIENLLIDNYEIGVPVYGIFCDATGVGYQTPLVSIGKGHINATKYGIYTKNWKSIQLTAPEIAISYDAATSGSSNAGVHIEGGNLLEYVGGSVNNIDSAANTAMVELVGTTNFTISAMTLNINYVTGKTQSAISLVSGTRDGVISGCTGKASSTSTYAFVFAQTGNATDDGILVTGNRASGFNTGIVSIDMRGIRETNNDFSGCTNYFSVGGTPYPGVVIERNTPFFRTSLNSNSATPNVAGIPDGAISLFNTAATTITNFTNPREGQVITLFAANANTTIAHNGNIFLQGSPGGGLPMGSSNTLTLQYISGVWIEQGRRT